MTRGQETLTIDMAAPAPGSGAAGLAEAAAGARGPGALRVVAPGAEELEAHRDYLEALEKESSGRCVWLRAEERADAPAPT